MPLQIAYLLEDTAISNLAMIVLAQADALVARGHRVRIVTKGSPVTWRSSRAEWVYIDELTAFAPDAGEIIANSEIIRANPIVDDDFYRMRMPPENQPMRVLLCGESQDEVNGIHEGYGAVAHARWFHQKLDLIRVSPWAPSQEEPLDTVQEFHVALSTAEMTRLMHSCDVLIAPNHREEGFGLRAAEAMASGIPTVLTSIPSYLSIDDTRDYALFAPEENAVELGEKLIELLSDAELRQRVRKRGREVAEQWRAPRVAERIEEFFLEWRTRG